MKTLLYLLLTVVFYSTFASAQDYRSALERAKEIKLLQDDRFAVRQVLYDFVSMIPVTNLKNFRKTVSRSKFSIQPANVTKIKKRFGTLRKDARFVSNFQPTTR